MVIVFQMFLIGSNYLTFVITIYYIAVGGKKDSVGQLRTQKNKWKKMIYKSDVPLDAFLGNQLSLPHQRFALGLGHD